MAVRACLVALLLGVATCHNDLVAQETSSPILDRPKYSSRISSRTELPFGLKLATTEKVLDFRIKDDEYVDYQNNEVVSAAAAGGAKQSSKEVLKKEDDDEEKTLAQQVAEGKYGLIQNELFSNGSKRPGIISYLANPEVPRDTKHNLGGLDKEEIWLAEDHLLVLRGGRLPEGGETKKPQAWPPIDNYEAPPRQVKIPDRPKIPPPFPVQLSENGPVELVKGENGSTGQPPFLSGPFPFPSGPPPFPFPADDNRTLPFPGPLPPFLANLPPGAAFLPPPGNFTDFDEDDPSIYYPPKYDFYYPQDNTTAVPPGPLVPGIILPPPPNFFAPLDEENDTDNAIRTTKPPFLGPVYLPAKPRRPPTRIHTTTTLPPDISNQIPESSPSPYHVTRHKPSVTYVYPENSPKTTTQRPPYRDKYKFTSPIYVPDENEVTYHPLPTTSPKPNHITIPTTKGLSQEIYIVSTPESKEAVKEIYKQPKPKIPFEKLRPEVHPLRSLIKPNVTVSYVGKVGHLPASTPFPFPKRPFDETKTRKPLRGGHYITTASSPPRPELNDNFITTQVPLTELSLVTVTPVPVVKKIRVRPIGADSSPADPTPTKATIYFYEETTTTQSPRVKTTSEDVRYDTAVSTPRPPIRQFLEETFHASNVLQNKPHIGPTKTNPNVYDAAKMKHVYGSPVRQQQQRPKYHYVTQEEPVMIPKAVVSTTTYRTPQVTPSIPTTTPAPADGPFVPSNYYATARPDNIHFTAQDHAMMDDITKNYFTIFGQKINNNGGPPTTPLAPIEVKPTERPKYVQVVSPPPPPPPPQSHFEQYLKELTGEDQDEYVVTGSKLKKGKAQGGFAVQLPPGLLPELPPDQLYITAPRPPPPPAQFIKHQVKRPYPYDAPKIQYRPVYSTTLRPVMNVEIQPQYVQHVSSTYRPFVSSHNFGQYLQEISSFTSPTTVAPVRKPPPSNLRYFPSTRKPPPGYQFAEPDIKPPVSLEGDILVNYKPPRPGIDPNAELIDPQHPAPFAGGSNFRIVDPPDLSGKPYRSRPPDLDPTKEFFENLPNSGYFAPAHQGPGNSFVSYNLPGNGGGHFYFLTPQIVDRSDGDVSEENYRRRKSDEPPNAQRTRLTGQQQQGTDYLRRRRKKP